MSQDNQEFALTPYIGRLREEVEAELVRVLGLPPALPLGWTEPPLTGKNGVGRVVVALTAPSGDRMKMDLTDARPGDGIFAQGGGLFLSLPRMQDQVDPLEHPEFRRVLIGLARRFRLLEDRDLSSRLRGLLEAARAYRGCDDWMFVEVPRSSKGSAYLRVGFRCNQDCGFCWQDRTWPDAPDEVIFTWLDELAERGIRRLAISGGEPTLFRRLPELIERAHRKHKMLVMLQTNAIRLGKEAYTASLVRAGLKELFVSFHSPDAKESDLMTRAPCTHERTVSGIEASLRAGLKVGLNCVVERSNYRSLPSHAQFIIDRFVRPFAKAAVFVEYSHPSASHDVARYEAMTATCEEVAPFLRDALRLLNDSGVAAKAFGSCGFPPCMMQDSAELIQWVDTASVSGRPGRMYAAACDACAAKRYCLGLRNEYVALHGTSVARPFANPPRRRRR